MKLSIYQIDLDRDTNGVAFESYDSLSKFQKSQEIDADIYNKVYEGEVEAKDIEDVYRIFNIEQPEDYKGRSLSVSDVVEVKESENVKPGCYYCDSIGFKDIEFDVSETHKPKENTITVVMCEPGKKAYVTEIGNGLEELQKAVEGCIEAFYPFESEECVVCNDEGKFNGSSPCRAFYDDEGKVMDIVFGKFFICDCSGENFGSLSEEKQKQYLKQFGSPEHFFRVGGEIQAIKYEPQEKAAEGKGDR